MIQFLALLGILGLVGRTLSLKPTLDGINFKPTPKPALEYQA